MTTERSVCDGCGMRPRCITRNLACRERYNEVRGLPYRKDSRIPKAHLGRVVEAELVSIERRRERRELEASRPPIPRAVPDPLGQWARDFFSRSR